MKIIDKLKKLIAHEESARAIGNTAEAEAFAGKIQELLDAHNLSMSEVELHDAQNSPIEFEPVQDEVTNIENWQRVLLFNIAQINGCYPLEHRFGFQIVVGRARDREIVISLFKYFEKLGRELADNFIEPMPNLVSNGFGFYVDFGFSSQSEETRRKSFLLGFASSVCQRLEQTRKKDTEQSEHSAALVFLDNRQKENEEFVKQRGNVESVNLDPVSDIDRRAFMRGASAGDSVALTDKVIG